MLSAEQNELITRTNPGTKAGNLLRRYWQPAALVEELPPPAGAAGAFLGEDLVSAPRRGPVRTDRPRLPASRSRPQLRPARGRRPALLVPRLEIRVNGQCLEAPGEPEGSNLCANIRQKSYPVVEKSGILFAYMGPGDPPAFPKFDCFVAPDELHLRLQGPDRMQLAAIARSRHRPGAHTPGCIASSRTRILRESLWPPCSGIPRPRMPTCR